MPIVKLTFDDEHYEKLKRLAGEKSIQQYIRDLVFGENVLFSPEEAVKRAQNKYTQGQKFELPNLYTQEEWSKLGTGAAGVFGKRFNKYIMDNPDKNIVFVTMGRRAVYKMK